MVAERPRPRRGFGTNGHGGLAILDERDQVGRAREGRDALHRGWGSPRPAALARPAVDTLDMYPYHESMTTRTKRTYNLDEATIRHVREMSADYGVAESQDAVVELAVERLYGEALDRVERELWAAAALDPEFVAEIREISADLDGDESWPT